MIIPPVNNYDQNLIPHEITVPDFPAPAAQCTENDVLDFIKTSSLLAQKEQQPEEKDVQKARKILGKLAADFTTEEVKDIMTEVKCLTESWLDDFERQIFDGQTLQEVLHERGKI